MASTKRIEIELLAVGFAAAMMALFAGGQSASNSCDSNYLTMSQARMESAAYLDAAPTQSLFDRTTERWSVTDGKTTAWLDARSGELVEIELEPSR